MEKAVLPPLRKSRIEMNFSSWRKPHSQIEVSGDDSSFSAPVLRVGNFYITKIGNVLHWLSPCCRGAWDLEADAIPFNSPKEMVCMECYDCYLVPSNVQVKFDFNRLSGDFQSLTESLSKPLSLFFDGMEAHLIAMELVLELRDDRFYNGEWFDEVYGV